MIKITVISYNNEAPQSPMSAVFDQVGGTMGRSDDNFFVLPDTTHYVSRSQASISSDGMRHVLVNLSQANPILVNGQEIEPEADHEIFVGDEIHIGLYLLRAEPHDSAPVTSSLEDQPAQSPPSQAIQQPESIAPVTPLMIEKKPEAEAPDPDVEAHVLLQAFLKGAGIPPATISAGLSPELMEMLGKLMATSIQGAIELIALRALVKREVNAEVTMVVVRNNNPLKFFPDSQTVLIQMLRKKMPGFMAPIEAIEDVYEDLRAHQLGVVAGMRSAMGALLKRLSPDIMEARVAAPNMLDSMMPSRRKAAMWDHYAQQFGRVLHETKDDFHTLFGKDFLVAYEKEVERFKDGLHDD